MKITCKEFPGKTFESKAELYAELRKHVAELIAVKKAEVIETKNRAAAFGGFLLRTDTVADKTGPQMKDGYIYPVINTSWYMDSHRDVHFSGLWAKSVKDQAGKLFYVVDHELKVNSVIAWPEDVKAMVKEIPWSFVGKSFSGKTEALIYEIPKNKIVHDLARKIIEEKRPVQNSVRMMYVKIGLGMDSDRDEDKEYKAYYEQHIGKIANREDVEELGYFWGIEEAKILTEGSMVLRGSNDATSVQQKDIGPGKSTQTGAADRTQVRKALNNLLQNIQSVKA